MYCGVMAQPIAHLLRAVADEVYDHGLHGAHIHPKYGLVMRDAVSEMIDIGDLGLQRGARRRRIRERQQPPHVGLPQRAVVFVPE
jgi:hypothetical protein